MKRVEDVAVRLWPYRWWLGLSGISLFFVPVLVTSAVLALGISVHTIQIGQSVVVSTGFILWAVLCSVVLRKGPQAHPIVCFGIQVFRGYAVVFLALAFVAAVCMPVFVASHVVQAQLGVQADGLEVPLGSAVLLQGRGLT